MYEHHYIMNCCYLKILYYLDITMFLTISSMFLTKLHVNYVFLM
jgi:hypothetical protein